MPLEQKSRISFAEEILFPMFNICIIIFDCRYPDSGVHWSRPRRVYWWIGSISRLLLYEEVMASKYTANTINYSTLSTILLNTMHDI
jgi:hypothetical protein